MRIQPAAEQAHLWVEDEQPQNGGDRRRDRIGPDQQRAVDRAATDLVVREYREEHCDAHRQHADGGTEDQRANDGIDVERVREQIGEILETDEGGAEAERILSGEARPDCLTGRP